MDNWIVTELADTDGLILGITTDNDDNIYFTTGYRGLWKLSKNGQLECLIERDGNTYMAGIVWNGLNTLYICDYMHGIVSYHLKTRKYQVLVEDEGHEDGNFYEAKFYRPWGIAMDRNGILYVCEKYCVRKIDLEQKMVSTIAGTHWDENNPQSNSFDCEPIKDFEDLAGIAINYSSVYVCDQTYNCISTIDKDGTNQEATLTHTKCASPHGIVVDQQGRLIVAGREGLRRVDLVNDTQTPIAQNLVKEVWTIAMDRHGALIMESCTIKGEYQLVMLQPVWSVERFLWLGKMKEEPSYCKLALLPNDLVREIASYLKTRVPISTPPQKRFKPEQLKKIRTF